jgi:hypothetical protein
VDQILIQEAGQGSGEWGGGGARGKEDGELGVGGAAVQDGDRSFGIVRYQELGGGKHRERWGNLEAVVKEQMHGEQSGAGIGENIAEQIGLRVADDECRKLRMLAG